MGKLIQGLFIDLPFEIDHLPQGLPVSYPAPSVEFRFLASIKAEGIFPAVEPQEEPALLLADAQGIATAANESFGKSVPEPTLGAPQHRNLMGTQPHLFF